MKKHVFLLIYCTMISLQANSQILQIKEMTENTKKIIHLEPFSIIDINCKLEIKLNTDSLGVKISRSAKRNTELLDKLDRLNFVLKNQIEILNILSNNIKSASQAEDIKILENYSVLMFDFYNRLGRDTILYKEANTLFREYFNIGNKIDTVIYPSPQAYVIKKLSYCGKDILYDIQESEELKKVQIQMTAFINTKEQYNNKVHIENFDQYAVGEFYNVPRWVTAFSEDDIERFKQTRDLANKLNKIVDSNLSDLTNFLNEQFQSISSVENLIKTAQNLIENRKTLFTDNDSSAISYLLAIKFELDGLLRIINGLTNFSELGKNGIILELFNISSQQFINTIKNLPNTIDSLSKKLLLDLKDSNSPLFAFIDSIRSCEVKLKSDVDKVISITQYASNLLTPFKNTANSAQEIGDEVFSFTLSDLPNTGYIDLRTTGKRDNGDELVVRVIARTEDQVQKNIPGQTIEMRTLTIQQVKFYSVSKVTLIVAKPMDNSTDVKLENKFQFAPSGSLLLKFGSRNCKTWNFFNPGFGFNMSTPDFDLDGTPDAALGGVLTFLHDILSIGLDYNFKTDCPFWFFGLSIPFNMPGLPINTTQAQNNY
jgi:hypothetical protein